MSDWGNSQTQMSCYIQHCASQSPFIHSLSSDLIIYQLMMIHVEVTEDIGDL